MDDRCVLIVTKSNYIKMNKITKKTSDFNLMTHTFRDNAFSTPGVHWTPGPYKY